VPGARRAMCAGGSGVVKCGAGRGCCAAACACVLVAPRGRAHADATTAPLRSPLLLGPFAAPWLAAARRSVPWRRSTSTPPSGASTCSRCPARPPTFRCAARAHGSRPRAALVATLCSSSSS
jgi:hypothetical protein